MFRALRSQLAGAACALLAATHIALTGGVWAATGSQIVEHVSSGAACAS